MKKDCKQGYDEAQSFIIHESTIRMSSQLNDQQLGRLIRYFYRYAENGQTPGGEKNLAVTIIFNEWRLRYDIDKQQYESVCQKRSEAGRKGLAKRWDKSDESETTQEEETTIPSTPSASIDTQTTNEDTTTPNRPNDDESILVIANDSNAIQTIANIADNDSDNDSDSESKETSPEGEAKKKVSLPHSSNLQARKNTLEANKSTLETRKNDFYQSMVHYTDRYDREMLNDFYQYWTELDKRRRRMRFEMQKTWETGKRLATWARRQNP